MATLNTTIHDDEHDHEESTRLKDPPLAWHWRTWPAGLKRAAQVTAGVVLVAAVLIGVLRWADKDFTRRLQAETNNQVQSHAQLRNSDQERSDIERHLPLLRELETSGVFGEEKRLEWIEHLRAIEKHWPGVRLQYSINVQSVLTPKHIGPGLPPPPPPLGLLPNGEKAKKFDVFMTDMKLTLKLMHEGDALAIVDELQSASLGRVTIKSCEFRRLGGSNSAPPTPGKVTGFTASIDAECNLTWISMRAYSPT